MNPIARLLRTLARPVRRGTEHRGLLIQPYRGYGSNKSVFLMGRVFRQPGSRAIAPEGRLLRDLFRFIRRMLRRGAGDRDVVMRFDEREHRSTTDRDGYFRFRIDAEETFSVSGGWNSASLRLGEDPEVHSEAEVYIAPADAEFVVISDIDDTVMYTGVANKLKMFWRLFGKGAHSRVAFPGVGAFYRALHAGASGDQGNPMLYVSRGPWSIYEMLETFFQRNDIPVGPILFLRDWGLTLQRPLPRRATEHKHDLIEEMLHLYEDFPFVLIGDSGQHDPEVYADFVERHPGRVTAVYIRDVTGSETRAGEIDKLAEAVRAADSDLVLTDDTDDMVEHARENGLIRSSSS